MLKYSTNLWRAGLGLIVVSMTLVCSNGCGKRPEPLPPTYPVHGVVKYKNGSLVTGGVVQFYPEAEPSVTTTGTIGNDGSYSLTTTRPQLRSVGAVAGPNRVSVLACSAKGSAAQRPDAFFNFPKPYAVKSPDNEINLELNITP